MEKLKLRVATREVLGKKVKSLRRNGITPVHIYGPDVKSQSLQIDTHSLEDVLKRAGSTNLISLLIDDTKRSQKVMVAEVQKEAISGRLIHVDFQQIRMTQVVTVDVPLKFVGESPVANSKTVKLLKNMTSISVECMPDNIPSSISVDISELDEATSPIHAKDIQLPEEVKLITSPESLLIKVYRPRLEELEVEAVTEEVEGEVAEVAEDKTETGEGEGESKTQSQSSKP